MQFLNETDLRADSVRPWAVPASFDRKSAMRFIAAAALF